MAVTRWLGKPTSGRYVHKCPGGWFWQCDLHPGDYGEHPPEGTPVYPTFEAALADAIAHAVECPFSNYPHGRAPEGASS